MTSTPFPARLTTGSLVMQVELNGDRLCYDRIAGTGAGPNSGWAWRPSHLERMCGLRCRCAWASRSSLCHGLSSLNSIDTRT